MVANESGMSPSVLSGSAAGQPVIAMSGADPEPRKARGQEVNAAVAPFDIPPSLFRYTEIKVP